VLLKAQLKKGLQTIKQGTQNHNKKRSFVNIRTSSWTYKFILLLYMTVFVNKLTTRVKVTVQTTSV